MDIEKECVLIPFSKLTYYTFIVYQIIIRLNNRIKYIISFSTGRFSSTPVQRISRGRAVLTLEIFKSNGKRHGLDFTDFVSTQLQITHIILMKF